MKDLLHYIVALIVEKPESVSISETDTEGVTNFAISTDPDDIGKVIGKEGKIIRAIRNVIKIPAIKEGKRINISIAEQTPPAA